MDFGCFAPLTFLSVFREKGLDITYRQAREPMGLLKVDHIRILEMDPVREQFERSIAVPGMRPTCGSFTPGLKRTCSPPEGFHHTHSRRGGNAGGAEGQGIKVRSTTGYTAEMMDIVRPGAAARGYVVDNLVTPDEVPAGRPRRTWFTERH